MLVHIGGQHVRMLSTRAFTQYYDIRIIAAAACMSVVKTTRGELDVDYNGYVDLDLRRVKL